MSQAWSGECPGLQEGQAKRHRSVHTCPLSTQKLVTQQAGLPSCSAQQRSNGVPIREHLCRTDTLNSEPPNRTGKSMYPRRWWAASHLHTEGKAPAAQPPEGPLPCPHWRRPPRVAVQPEDRTKLCSRTSGIRCLQPRTSSRALRLGLRLFSGHTGVSFNPPPLVLSVTPPSRGADGNTKLHWGLRRLGRHGAELSHHTQLKPRRLGSPYSPVTI